MTQQKRTLKVLDKSLATEILPDPTQANAGAFGPRQRVLTRLKQLTRHTGVLAAAASLSAACGTTQTGSGIPNPQAGAGGAGGSGGVSGSDAGIAGTGVIAGFGGTGGFGGYSGDAGTTAGTAGYGVVDPLPPPYLCPTSGELANEASSATHVQWDNFSVTLSVQLSNSMYANGTFLQSVSNNANLPVTVTSSAQPASATIQVTQGSWPASVQVILSFSCNSASGLINYQYIIDMNTSLPAATGDVPYTIVTGDQDAGFGG